MVPIKPLTFDELLEQNWNLDTVVSESARVEFLQFGNGAYTANDFTRMHAAPGSLSALLFPANRVETNGALGIEACVERRAADGTIAHQLVTIAIDPAMTGQGLGPLLDKYCESLILTHGYLLRILRSRAPSSIYAKYGGRVGGSPHGEATRFAVKRGFQLMSAEESLNFFGDDIARLLVDDVNIGDKILRDCFFAESHSKVGKPPWYFICMRKVC